MREFVSLTFTTLIIIESINSIFFVPFISWKQLISIVITIIGYLLLVFLFPSVFDMEGVTWKLIGLFVCIGIANQSRSPFSRPTFSN